MANDCEHEVDTLEVTRTTLLFDLDDAPGIAYSLEPQLPQDEDLILDAEDVAAELMPDGPCLPPPPRARSQTRSAAVSSITQPPAASPQPAAASSQPVAARSSVPPRAPRLSSVPPRAPRLSSVPPRAPRLSSVPPVGASVPPPMAAKPAADSSDLAAAQAEIERLQRQMRARDAYLIEIERALDASTRQLEASGLGCVDDAVRLLGRVRGQAFRIAELESELRQAQTGAPKTRKSAEPTRTRTRVRTRPDERERSARTRGSSVS